jgi:hypothetical protein
MLRVELGFLCQWRWEACSAQNDSGSVREWCWTSSWGWEDIFWKDLASECMRRLRSIRTLAVEKLADLNGAQLD